MLLLTAPSSRSLSCGFLTHTHTHSVMHQVHREQTFLGDNTRQKRKKKEGRKSYFSIFILHGTLEHGKMSAPIWQTTLFLPSNLVSPFVMYYLSLFSCPSTYILKNTRPTIGSPSNFVIPNRCDSFRKWRTSQSARPSFLPQTCAYVPVCYVPESRENPLRQTEETVANK